MTGFVFLRLTRDVNVFPDRVRFAVTPVVDMDVVVRLEIVCALDGAIVVGWALSASPALVCVCLYVRPRKCASSAFNARWESCAHPYWDARSRYIVNRQPQ